MMKVERQQVERRRRENRGAEGVPGWGLWKGCPSPQLGGAWEGDCGPSPEPPPQNFFFNFLSPYAAFWVQSDAFSDIARPVRNSLHSQRAESSDIIKPASATLGIRDAGHFK